LALIIFVSLFPSFSPLLAQNAITLNGQVKMGTSGSTLPVGLPLKLSVFRADPVKAQAPTPDPVGSVQEVITQTTALSATGQFSFPSIPLQVGDVYVVTTIYEGITQGSGLLTHGATSNTRAALTATPRPDTSPITVILYDRTPSAEKIVIAATNHSLSFLTAKTMRVLESVTVLNRGDRFYLSPQTTPAGVPISVSFPLPVGAVAITFNTLPTTRFHIGGPVNQAIIQDTKPVMPNQPEEIIYGYDLEYLGSAIIDRDYLYPLAGLQITIPADAGITLTGYNFTRGQSNAAQTGRPLNTYTIPNPPLKNNVRLIYKVDGIAQTPEARGENRSDTTALIVGTAVTFVALLFLGVGVGLYMGQRQARREQDE
jgi:hypothetical protein